MTAPDPLVVSLEHAAPESADPHEWQFLVHEGRDQAAKALTQMVPVRYGDAVATLPEVRGWVRALVEASMPEFQHLPPVVATGPSLLLIGPTGTGKTFQAWGALRALALSGVRCLPLEVVNAADLYARLRPRPHVDSEDLLHQFTHARLLVIDDLGGAKGSEWTEEVNYRLINYRYEHERPTLITSNVPPADLADALGDRVASRLVEMARIAVLKGSDRRRQKRAA